MNLGGLLAHAERCWSLVEDEAVVHVLAGRTDEAKRLRVVIVQQVNLKRYVAVGERLRFLHGSRVDGTVDHVAADYVAVSLSATNNDCAGVQVIGVHDLAVLVAQRGVVEAL